MKFGIFSNNVLKIIACVTMLIDHIGAILFPTVYALRFIGRISLPIFIFLLAEGCYYTKNKIRHLLVMGSFAVVMQVVLYLATKIIFFSIFIHFTIAIILCYIIDIIDIFIRCKKTLLSIAMILGFITISVLLFLIDRNTMYFYGNYGIYAIFTPVAVYIIRKYVKHIHLFLSIIVICISMVLMELFTPYYLQIYGMLGCIFILLYNGKKGKLNLKYLFYIFYPLHMAILYGISMLIGG